MENQPQQTTVPTDPTNEGLAAMQGRKFRIPGDIVNRATASLPDDQRSAIRWMHNHCAELDLDLDQAAEKIRYDKSNLWRVFHGKYEGNLTKVVKEITEYRRLYEIRNQGAKLAYIETALSKKIARVCDAALEFQRIAFIIGDSQIGKTTALEQYTKDHNHGSTVMIRMPTGGTITHFLFNLATALRISPTQSEKHLTTRIMAAFDDRMLLIVDEAHQSCYAKSERAGTRSIEFIRELHDTRKCGVVISATRVFDHEMEQGRFSSILTQIKRRRVCKLMLPDSPTAADLNTFAAAYGLPPATGEYLDLQTQTIRSEALGMWLTLLRMAAKLSARKNQPITWEYVQKAHNGLKSLETL
jgi:DNA transposition AAA+ family ATPase